MAPYVTVTGPKDGATAAGGWPSVAYARNFEAGIALENYHRRGLLRGVVVAHNNVYRNGQGGIWIPEAERVEALVLNNAVHARGGKAALPPARPGLRLAGNADCTWMLCFANPEGLDLSPFPGSPLMGAAVPRADGTLPDDDFFGSRRRLPASVGAVERSSGPIHPGIRPQ